jgi:tetratricopeptide (TPR) repeat protein
LQEAARCFRIAGDAASELRVLQRAHARAALSGEALDRYSALLLAQPASLNAMLAQETRAQAAYGVLNYVMGHGNAAVARQAIAARAARDGALWTKAYTALSGLYYSSNTIAVRTAFSGLLGDMTIGARIGQPVDRNSQLAGDLWFYYGGRFGEYLAAAKQPGSEDYLPASVEGTPARADAYFALAEYFAGAGNEAGAAQDYRNALELDPSRADAHDRLAVLAAKTGRNDDAVAEWKLALQACTEQMNSGRLPLQFWGDLNATLVPIADAKLTASLREEADRVLRLYVRRNGSFQADLLLQGAITFAGTPAAGVSWMGELAQSAPDPVQFLRYLIESDWIPDSERGPLHQRVVESAQTRAAQLFGVARMDAEAQMGRRRSRTPSTCWTMGGSPRSTCFQKMFAGNTRGKSFRWSCGPLRGAGNWRRSLHSTQKPRSPSTCATRRRRCAEAETWLRRAALRSFCMNMRWRAEARMHRRSWAWRRSGWSRTIRQARWRCCGECRW